MNGSHLTPMTDDAFDSEASRVVSRRSWCLPSVACGDSFAPPFVRRCSAAARSSGWPPRACLLLRHAAVRALCFSTWCISHGDTSPWFLCFGGAGSPLRCATTVEMCFWSELGACAASFARFSGLFSIAGAIGSGRCHGQSVRGSVSFSNTCSNVADQPSRAVRGPSGILRILRTVAIIDVRSYALSGAGFTLLGGSPITSPFGTHGLISNVGMRTPKRSKENWSGYDGIPSPGAGACCGGGTWS
mmetsp:Transcript_26116/g.80671  ORF Transcript_26116/g.80671 Transcript_26116/m.80671 type:complete len:245 (+) Transcript_26116:190-924(+)